MMIPRRYSEFYQLVHSLADDFGVDVSDLPCKIPPKSYGFSSTSRTVLERQEKLAAFLQLAVKDTEIQNNRIFLEFLKLPSDFKLSSIYKQGLTAVSDLSFPPNIDEQLWLELFRKYKQCAHEHEIAYKNATASGDSLGSNIIIGGSSIIDGTARQADGKTNTADDKNKTKEKVRIKEDCLDLQRHLDKLVGAIDKLLISAKEKQKKEAAVVGLKKQVAQIGNDSRNGESARRASAWGLTNGAKHHERAVETNNTMPLTNQELLQYQVQIHRNQDQEAWELRKLVQKQRELAELINTEVTEQSELLDGLDRDADNTAAKVRGARLRLKNL